MKNFPQGKILNVDLTHKKIWIETLESDTFQKYAGGSALGTYLTLKNTEKGIDPLSEKNVLVFATSVVSGFPVAGTSRVNVSTKSPLTGGIADSQAGGFFPAHFANNGYHAIVFLGKSETPVYVYVDKETVEIKDGKNIWGKVTGDAESIIREEVGSNDVEIAQIGPGGENLVKFASIMNMSNRANGRNGVGAVMGSKNLKALVVKKQKVGQAYDPEALKAFTKDVKEKFENNEVLPGLGVDGTAAELVDTNGEGFMPSYNFSSGYFGEKAANITGATVTKEVLKERDTCYACPVRCKRVVEIPGKVDPMYGGPEYETCGTFGTYCGVDNLEAVCIANQECNKYGLDTISCGATISFAMECFDKGILTEADTDGMNITYGNGEIFKELIKKIAYKEGFGAILAEGSYRAAEKIGKGAESCCVTVKKQELPAHMPQFKPMLGLIYAVGNIGADHMSNEHDHSVCYDEGSPERARLASIGCTKVYEDQLSMDDEKVKFAAQGQKLFAALDTLGLCVFVWGPSWNLYGPSDMVKLCKAAAGWDATIEEILEIGERRINMMRWFNYREGFSDKDDVLPKRIFEPMKDGPAKGHCLNEKAFDQAKSMYYKYMGWTEEGKPTEETLARLGLSFLESL